MTLLKKTSYLFLLAVLAVFLLEVSSFLYWEFVLSKRFSRSQLHIFDPVTPSGVIVPSAAGAVPVKRNYSSRWTTAEFDVNVKTDSRGLRHQHKDELRLEDVEIAFFGDSFTFGHGVEEEERFTHVATRYLEKEDKAINFSYINGWQPEHYEYYLKANPQLAPEYTVLNVYLGNDFHADVLETVYDPEKNQLELPYRNIHSDGYLISDHTVYRFGLGTLRDHSYLFKTFLVYAQQRSIGRYLFHQHLNPNSPNSIAVEKGEETAESGRAYTAILRINELLQSKAGKMIVVIIPQNYFFGSGNPHINPLLRDSIPQMIHGPNLRSALIEKFKADQIYFVDASDVLIPSHYYPLDGHWNREGHQAVGELVADYLDELALCR